MSIAGDKRKVLMLHGFVQSGKIFSSKTGGLRKSLKNLGYELYYPTAPLKVDKQTLAKLHGYADNNDEKSMDIASEFSTLNTTSDLYGWYIRNGPGLTQFELEQRVLNYLHDYIIENGPFEGLIGFSQGAGIAGYFLTNFNKILNLTQEQQPEFKFFVSFSGFKLEADHLNKSYEEHLLHVPSLHVQGELDTVVTEARSMELYDCFDEKTKALLKHPGGHFVPNSKNFVMQICSWLQKTTSSSNSFGAEVRQPTSKTDAPELDDDLMSMIDSMGKA